MQLASARLSRTSASWFPEKLAQTRINLEIGTVMDNDIAQECLRRMICSILRRSGFDASTPEAVAELEDKVLLFVGGLLHIAHAYADLARRTKLTHIDLLKACEWQDINPDELSAELAKTLAMQRTDTDRIALEAAAPLNPKELNPLQSFLPDSREDVSRRATYAPFHLPPLPPSHSYRRTPVFPAVSTSEQAKVAQVDLVTQSPAEESQRKASQQETMKAGARMSQLDERIRVTRLVEASLQNLIQATSKAHKPTDDLDGEREQDGMDEDPMRGAVVVSDKGKTKTKEDILFLLRRYEKDAAVCNFELEWYAAGGTNLVQQSQLKRDTLAINAKDATAQARKKGRWKV